MSLNQEKNPTFTSAVNIIAGTSLTIVKHASHIQEEKWDGNKKRKKNSVTIWCSFYPFLPRFAFKTFELQELRYKQKNYRHITSFTKKRKEKKWRGEVEQKKAQQHASSPYSKLLQKEKITEKKSLTGKYDERRNSGQ